MSEEMDVIVQKRDQLVEDASKAAKEQRFYMVEAEAACEASEKASQDEFVARFVPAFEDRLTDLKSDHSIELKDHKRTSFWKGYVHRQKMCALVHPPLEDLVVPRSVRDWESWQATSVSNYQPLVDASDGEEENLEADFPEYTEPALD